MLYLRRRVAVVVAWMLFGFCLDSVWIPCRACLDYVSILLEYVWVMIGATGLVQISDDLVKALLDADLMVMQQKRTNNGTNQH